MTQESFQKRSLILPVFLPSILFSTGEASLFPVLPTNATNLGADLPTAGLIAGLLMMGMVFFDLPAATLVRKIGERNAMIWAAAVASVSILGALLARDLFTLGLFVFIGGSTTSVFGLARHGYMADNVPLAQRARSLALLGGMFRGGYFLGPVIGSVIVFLFDPHAVYWVAIIFCAAAALCLVVFTRPDQRDTHSVGTVSSPWSVAKQESKKLATVGLAAAILAALRTARTIGLPLWGIYIGLHPGATSLIIGVAGAVDFALFYASGQVMDRFGRRWAAIPTLFGMAVTMAALLLADTQSAFFIAAIAMSLANALGSGVIMVLGADLAPAGQTNEFLAGYRLLVDLGQAATPPLISGITAAVSLPAALGTMSVVSLVGAGLLLRYLPKFGIR